MGVYEGEIATLSRVGGPAFQAIRRHYELKEKNPAPGETVFRALGEYAIHRPTNDVWQLLPEERWAEVQHFHNEQYPGQWATAEDLRTRAGKGSFSSDHMDLIDESLFRGERKTNTTTELTVSSEADLRALLADHSIPTNHWSASVHRLYNDIKPVEPSKETENISLHLVDGALWLSTAQTMVNVYHVGKDDQLYKLQETYITHFDEHNNPRTPVKSKIRSSIGETGHITDGRPERPFATAMRGLREELGLGIHDFAKVISLDSILRLKEAGHHSFRPIKAEDRTHYFRVDLKPEAVRPKYINEERDANGKLRARIELEWFLPD